MTTDMAQTIAPKSDQLNADDLIAGPITIKIREVRISPGTEQPVAVFYEGDAGKPYLPCKSMRRVMVSLWGPNAAAYSGRGMTLFRDPAVMWGGMEVGGIRISHMSHIAERTAVVLTANKKQRKPFIVLPLVMPADKVDTSPPKDSGEKAATVWAESVLARIKEAQTTDAVHDIAGDPDVNKRRNRLQQAYPSLDEKIAAALSVRFEELNNG